MFFLTVVSGQHRPWGSWQAPEAVGTGTDHTFPFCAQFPFVLSLSVVGECCGRSPPDVMLSGCVCPGILPSGQYAWHHFLPHHSIS